MIPLLSGGAIAFGLSIFLTPFAIRFLRGRNVGQFIQEDVEGHLHKRGTPTMGGTIMVLAVVIAYLAAHLRIWTPDNGIGLSMRDFESPGLLALWAFVGMGLIGFLDDVSKVSRARNLGLNKRWKFAGQLVVAAVFAFWAVDVGVSTELSFTRVLGLDLGPFYVVMVLVMLTATANAVNLTDGLDGLASGSGALVFAAFTIIGFWQFRHPEFYGIEGTLELAILSTALLGAALGFLWWNTAPARIFMGDTGSQALGGAMAAFALLTNTQLLLVVLGGLYVIITLSVILQVGSYRMFGRRIFKMAPLHHHFELKGWPETTVIVRFWILAGISVAVGLGLFYGDFITSGGAG
ncbi:MAG: phospho-N-acetylmuramoyl-pentapeptide-transferase [Acidimicrobiia bacterium]